MNPSSNLSSVTSSIGAGQRSLSSIQQPSNNGSHGASSVSETDQKIQKLDPPGSSSPAEVKPSYHDDDEFYIFYSSGLLARGDILKKEGIEKLSMDFPGIFDGLEKPDDIFEADPIRYQPLAKFFHTCSDRVLESITNLSFHLPIWDVQKLPYGLYKYGFYEFEEDEWGIRSVKLHHDGYEKKKKEKLFVSQLRSLLFDECMSCEEKVNGLQMLLPPKEDECEEVSIDQIFENMDSLFGDAFKKAQQRAIEAGYMP